MPLPVVPIMIGTILGTGLTLVAAMIAQLAGHEDGEQLQKEYDKESKENQEHG